MVFVVLLNSLRICLFEGILSNLYFFLSGTGEMLFKRFSDLLKPITFSS